MKKIFLTAAAAVALSGGLYADTISSVGPTSGSLTAFPTLPLTTTAYSATPPYPATGNPFWNNPSYDTFGTGLSTTQHMANIGYLLTDTGAFATTAINVIPGDSVSQDFVGAGGVDPSGFSITQTAASENIALIFAAGGGDNTGQAPSATQVGTEIGYYTGTFTSATASNSTILYGNLSNTTTALSATNFSPTASYGFFAIVCYAQGGCETYTSTQGNFAAFGGAGFAGDTWNHFALFTTTNGNIVVGFTGQNGLYNENQGDFQDAVIEITNTSVPEPGTVGIIGLGLAGLGVLGRRRLAKK